MYIDDTDVEETEEELENEWLTLMDFNDEDFWL